MLDLLIVRHAESVGNATGNYSTDVADALSDRGWQQASALAEQLIPYRFDMIIVSPLRRAMETVTPYLDATDQRAELWPELAEACWHEQREPMADAWHPQPTDLAEPFTQRFAYRDGVAVTHRQGEPFSQGLRRVYEARQRLESLANNSSVLMVTHGHFIRELLNQMFHTDHATGHIENCGLTKLTYDGNWAQSGN